VEGTLMRLADVVERFEPDLLQRDEKRLTGDMQRALRCWRHCRGAEAPHLDCRCDACLASARLPQACGHRACPHCQHDLGEAWLEQQRSLRLPVDYFLLTFTLPAQLRGLARCHPRDVFAALMQCAWKRRWPISGTTAAALIWVPPPSCTPTAAHATSIRMCIWWSPAAG